LVISIIACIVGYFNMQNKYITNLSKNNMKIEYLNSAYVGTKSITSVDLPEARSILTGGPFNFGENILLSSGVIVNVENKGYIDDINNDIDDIEKDITNNIKPTITSSNIVSTVRNSNGYKNDLNDKVSTDSFESHKKDMDDYLRTTFFTINNNINKKANDEKVNGIDDRVKTLENNTSASNITSIVRNSFEYKTDLDKKSDKDKIISTVNSSTESELISKDKIEFPAEYYLDTIYTGNNIKIKNPFKRPEELTLDTIIDNIDFETTGLEITMNIDNIKETDYVTVLDNANIYMNNNEIIKLLLYEIQQLKIRISELENNN
jgi:hypothetical protein